MKIIKTCVMLTTILGAMLVMTSAASTYPDEEKGIPPIIKKLSTFRGNHFPGFAEFRVQKYEWNEFEMHLQGEPYEVLINVSNINQAYRFEDKKKTDYSTLMFVNYEKEPLLVRQQYKDVVSSIRKGMEALTK